MSVYQYPDVICESGWRRCGDGFCCDDKGSVYIGIVAITPVDQPHVPEVKDKEMLTSLLIGGTCVTALFVLIYLIVRYCCMFRPRQPRVALYEGTCGTPCTTTAHAQLQSRWRQMPQRTASAVLGLLPIRKPARDVAHPQTTQDVRLPIHTADQEDQPPPDYVTATNNVHSLPDQKWNV